MSVTDRLKRLTGEGDAPKNRQVRELRQRIDAIMSRRPGADHARPAQSRFRAGNLEEEIEGEVIEGGDGTFFLARRSLPGTALHGYRCVHDLASLDMQDASFLAGDRRIEGHTPADGLFLDTETTGLAGGTGTVAFLIGCGWFDGNSFVTEQIFMRDFREERAALSYLAEMAGERNFLVTFNGKTFDIALLATRFIMNRLPDPLSGMPHLDLLHPSRRLLGHRLPNSRLGTIEGAVLKFSRDGDIPGSEIPQRYFDWLRYGDPGLMQDVFEHNRLDIISMAALARHLAALVGAPDGREECTDSDILATTRLMIDRGCSDAARCRLASLVQDCHAGPVAQEARKTLSLIHKRSDQWEEAVTLWEAVLAENPRDYFAVEELAKWLEHRRHDYGRAADLVSGLLAQTGATTPDERDALAYRLNRLRRKLEK